MTKIQEITEQLSLFNNRTFTKKQWEIILKGCGCPKSAYFWMALRDNNLKQESLSGAKVYTLYDLNIETFTIIWDKYCINNRAGANKANKKALARKKVEETNRRFTGVSFYLVNGAITTEKPVLDR